MTDSRAQIIELVRLAVARMAAEPNDEQRYLELNFAVDRSVERELKYAELLELFQEGAEQAKLNVAWAWRLAAGLSANLIGDSPVASRWLTAAREELEAGNGGVCVVDSFLHSELARSHYHQGDHREGMACANQALQLALSANSLLAEAYARHYLGLISLRRREYDYARRHLVSARTLFERMNQRRGRARVLDSLAALDIDLGHFDKARALLEESLEVKQEFRDLRGQALTCGNLARLYTALGDYPQALHYLQRERELTDRIGDDRNATRLRVQLGDLHMGHGNPGLAREILLSARNLAQERHNPRLEAYACFLLAEAERQLGNLDGALDAIEAARDYFAEGDDPVMADRASLRRALLQGRDATSPAIREALTHLRESRASSQLSEALVEAAAILSERDGPESESAAQATALFAEALDVADPVQADQIAARIRSRARSVEGRQWVDAMLTVKQQKDSLEQAYAELRRVEKLRDSLTQMIVHDLKNPLAAITPWLLMLQMGGLTQEETSEHLQAAINECDYLLRIIEDLNDVGRMQLHEPPELNCEELDLPGLLSDVARRVEGRARESGFTLQVEPVPPLPPLRGDVKKLRRVLENLVANAVKYGRPPEASGHPPVVELAAFPEANPTGGPGTVRVEVRDRGEGIPAHEADRVFEAYYQAEAGRKRKAGVGLGLAFSRMIIDAHGGVIWTRPNPGGGTIFAFRLPASPPGE
jgi:signal transduction histidine kinase